jgi:hypothetical protein
MIALDALVVRSNAPATVALTATPAPTVAPTPAPTATPAPTVAPTVAPTPGPGDGYPANSSLTAAALATVSRPGYLAPVTDPTWGTTVTRVSSTAGVRQAYARISVWNSDQTRILLGYTYPGRMLDGTTYADLGSFSQIDHAIWSNTDPNKLFGPWANVLYSQNATTGALTALHTFSGYTSIDMGGGDGAIDDTDTYVALIGSTGSAYHLITYNIAANTIVADIPIAGNPGATQISRKGNYVVLNWGDGTGVNQGLERYTRDLTSRIQLSPYARHGDNALDAAGNEIFVTCSPDVSSYRLSSGAKTLLLSGPNAFEYGHVSGRNINRPGWAYLSVYDTVTPAGRPGNDQVVAVKTDGSGTVEVFAFANNRTNGSPYAGQPQAVPSRDGTRVLFASEWGGTGIYAYVAQH